MGTEITISRLGRHFSQDDTVQGTHRPHTAVADNTLTIKQKSTLPVSKTRQDKSLFCSLPGTYPPLLALERLAASDFRRTCATTIRHSTAPGSLLKSADSGCEPFLANPLLPEPPTCPAWPSAAFTSAGCEPFSANRLTPGSATQAPGPALWQRVHGNRQPPAMLLC